MSWSNPEAVAYLLENEEVFWSNYCSTQTKIVLEENEINRDENSFSSFYFIVKRLAELMPDLDHNSPKYNETWNERELPLVALGKGNFRQNTDSFYVHPGNAVGGLFVWENQICLFGSSSFVKRNEELDWYSQHSWRGVEDGRSVFKTSVDLNSEKIPDGHPLHDNHPLAEALKNANEIGKQYEEKNKGKDLPTYPVYPKYAKLMK